MQYIQKNGVKYYKNNNNRVFSIVNGKRIYLTDTTARTYINEINNNQSAINYYKKAKEFTDWVKNNNILKNLTFGNAVEENGNTITDKDGTVNGLSGNTKIFESDNNISIEDTNSNFNEHRTAVIRYSIQKNLAMAIANFNKYSSSTNEFQMPNLSEEDWYSLINNVSCISFLQGLPIGGKIYNGYAVANNNKTQEFVSKESIYILSDDSYYHRVNENNLNEKSNLQGFFNVDFERKVYSVGDTKAYVYPHNQVGSYDSIVTQTQTEPKFYENENTYLSNKTNLAKAYYTALGRERYSMYRVNYDNYINFNAN